MDSQIALLHEKMHNDAIIKPLRDLRAKICHILKAKGKVSELDEQELKYYSILFLPIALISETDNENQYNLLIGVKERQVEIYDQKAYVNETLL